MDATLGRDSGSELVFVVVRIFTKTVSSKESSY